LVAPGLFVLFAEDFMIVKTNLSPESKAKTDISVTYIERQYLAGDSFYVSYSNLKMVHVAEDKRKIFRTIFQYQKSQHMMLFNK
jgi:hypothetical protein